MKYSKTQTRVFLTTLILQMAFLVYPLLAQSPLDDLLDNQLDSFQRKILLLDASYNDYPYLAFYLRKAKQVKVSSVETLLKQAADPNTPDDEGVFPIHLAVARGNLDIVKTLLNAGADVNKTIPLNKIVDYWTMYSGNRKMRIDSYEGLTPIQLSIILGYPSIVEYFLDLINPDMTIFASFNSGNIDQICLLEIPFWTKDGEPNATSLAVMKLLLTKKSPADKKEVISRFSEYDQLLVAILFDDVAMLKKNLLFTRKDINPYIVYAVLASSKETLDFLLRYEGLSYSAKFDIPMNLKYGSVSGGKEYWNRNLKKIPLYAYPFINGNSLMVAYLKTKGADFSEQFTTTIYDEQTDIPNSFMISGSNYQPYLEIDEAMKNALK
jgi:hypothetical protein